MNLLEIAQIMFVADLGVLAWFDYKYRGAYRVLFIPCWVSMILAALGLIRVATLFYALGLSIITLLLMLIGLKYRKSIGDGDIWLFMGFIWCFATFPYVLVATVVTTFLMMGLWPDSHEVPVATCLALALGVALPLMFVFGFYRF